MELLTYSSNDTSELNEARRQLWSSQYMLGMSTKNPGEYASPEFWEKMIDQDSSRLVAVARQLRAKLPARKLYRVPMKSQETGKVAFIIFERAHFNGQACVQAEDNYPHFTADVPEELSA